MNIQLSTHERELMAKALQVHGEYELISHAYRSLGQLVTVLDEYEREVTGREAIAEAIASMHIALSQLTVLVGENNVHYHIDRQIEQLDIALQKQSRDISE